MKEFIIQKNEENQRLDKYLKKLLPNATTSFLYKMMRKKNIVINKKKVTGNEKLVAGDVVSLFFSDETFDKFHVNLEELKAEYKQLQSLSLKGLKIIYEDEEMIVADKPYNMLSQKSSVKDISANEHLLGYMIKKGELSFEEFQTFRPSVVNRLDRNTTGLLLFGKTLNALQQLGEDIRERRIKKYYRAVVVGELKEELQLKGYLLKDEKTNKVSYHETQVEDSDYIETEVKPIHFISDNMLSDFQFHKNNKELQNDKLLSVKEETLSMINTKQLTLVEIHLITGKTHQIRLHLYSIGHPIIGDMKYGNQKINKKYYESHKVNHQLLHAYRLEFPDGRVVTAEPTAVFQKLFS